MKGIIVNLLEDFPKHQVSKYGINSETEINAMSDDQLVDLATTVVTRDMLREYFNSSYVLSHKILSNTEMTDRYNAFFKNMEFSISKITGISKLIENREWQEAKKVITEISKGERGDPEVKLALEYVNFLKELTEEIKQQLAQEKSISQSSAQNLDKTKDTQAEHNIMRKQIAKTITNMIFDFGVRVLKYGINHLYTEGLIYSPSDVSKNTSDTQLVDFATTLVVRDFLRSAPENKTTYFFSEDILKIAEMKDEYTKLCASSDAASIRAHFLTDEKDGLKEEYNDSWQKAKEAILADNIDTSLKQFLKEFTNRIIQKLDLKQVQTLPQKNEESNTIQEIKPENNQQNNTQEAESEHWTQLIKLEEKSKIPQYAVGCSIF